MTSNPQVKSRVDEALNETEIGSFIAKNKSLVVGAVIGILLAIVGHGFYTHSENKSNDEFNQKIYTFKTSSFEKYKNKELKTEEFIPQLNQLVQDIGSYSGLNLFLFQVSDELVVQNDLNNALAVLNQVQGVSNPYNAYFLATRKAAILEDLNKFQEALVELETLSDTSKQFLEGKIYLDMGRLQLKLGDKVKARSSFEYLENKTVQDEFSKLAKHYLYQMDKEAGTTNNMQEPATK